MDSNSLSHTNLKHKFGNHHFGEVGYYVSADCYPKRPPWDTLDGQTSSDIIAISLYEAGEILYLEALLWI